MSALSPRKIEVRTASIETMRAVSSMDASRASTLPCLLQVRDSGYGLRRRATRAAPGPLGLHPVVRVPGVVVKTVGVEFFCYHRDRPGSATLRDELLEEHWSYMDRYAAEVIARGPTLAGDTPTGSVRLVHLPDPAPARALARAFALDEPSYQAGVDRDVLLRRWRNLLGRTMWDFPGGRAGGDRYLVLGLVHALSQVRAGG